MDHVKEGWEPRHATTERAHPQDRRDGQVPGVHSQLSCSLDGGCEGGSAPLHGVLGNVGCPGEELRETLGRAT